MIEKACMFFEKNKMPILIGSSIFFIIFPFLFPSMYTVRMGTLCLMNIMMVLSLNLIIGMLGYISFGHAAFWGIGAYTAAILAKDFGMGSEVTFLAAALVAGFFGLVLGLTVLKLKGFNFAIVTMVFCEIIRAVELNWVDLTRGPMGISAIPKISFFGIKLTSTIASYFTILVMVAVCMLIIMNIRNSRTGRTAMAIRDDDQISSSMGINTFKYKVMIFVISSMMAGIAGAFYAQYTTYIDPSNFILNKSNEFLVMTIFGGMGNFVGSFIGAIGLTILPELLRDLANYRMLIYGILLVVLMHLRPQGLLGDINFKYIKQRRLLKQIVPPKQRFKKGKGEL